MPRHTTVPRWGLVDYLVEQTKPIEKEENRDYGGFMLKWKKSRAPSFEKLKKLTEGYLVNNSTSFEYRRSDVMTDGARAFEAVCTGYAGVHFRQGFNDVQTKVTLVRYDNKQGIFIKCYENWRFTPPGLIAGMFG